MAQLAPAKAVAHESGTTQEQGIDDLDRLEDQSISEGLAGIHAKGVQDRDARGLEDAYVRRCQPHDRRQVDRAQHRRGRALSRWR